MEGYTPTDSEHHNSSYHSIRYYQLHERALNEE